MIFEKLNSDNLKNYFIKLGLSNALVFESVLTDEFNEESDVDIAILSSSKLNIKAILNLKLNLDDLLDKPIDVIDLNSEKLDKIIEDMTEVLENLKECKSVLEETPEEKNILYIEFGLKQIFVDFFIIVEHLISMLLKENKKFKIGIDMKQSLFILNKDNVIYEEIYLFLVILINLIK